MSGTRCVLQCLADRQWCAYVQVLYQDAGWTWVEDGDKPGFMAEGGIGQLLRLGVAQSELRNFRRMPYIAHLGVVKSWRPYGMISIECRKGCECESFVEDLHDPQMRVTIQGMVDFPVYPGDLSEPCMVDIKVEPNSTSGGYYAKVMSLGVEPLQLQTSR
jgi:hypothetical protein